MRAITSKFSYYRVIWSEEDYIVEKEELWNCSVTFSAERLTNPQFNTCTRLKVTLVAV